MLFDERKLRHYLDKGWNVLFIGEHGVGKSSMVFKIFDSAGVKYKYFSGATLDPWVDFVGIPKDVNGMIEMVLPQWIKEGIEVIFMDEFNRTHKKVRNALMEAIQFRKINGQPLGKLKCVWAAINPKNDEERNYDVEPLDEAQEDRFQIQINVPYRVDDDYFQNKYGEYGERACQWWHELPKDAKKMVSPRRLDYAIEVWLEKGDINDVLRKGNGVDHVNVPKLLSMLGKGSIVPVLKNAIESNDVAKVKGILSDANNFESATQLLRTSDKALSFCIQDMSGKWYRNGDVFNDEWDGKFSEYQPLMGQERLVALMNDTEDDTIFKNTCRLFSELDTNAILTLSFLLDMSKDAEGKKRIKDGIEGNTQPFSVPYTSEPIFKLGSGNNPSAIKEFAEKIRLSVLTPSRVGPLQEFVKHVNVNMTLSQEDTALLTETVDEYCKRSNWLSLLAVREDLVSVYNLAAKNTSPDLSIAHQEIFTKYPRIHHRFSLSRLVNHIL